MGKGSCEWGSPALGKRMEWGLPEQKRGFRFLLDHLAWGSGGWLLPSMDKVWFGYRRGPHLGKERYQCP